MSVLLLEGIASPSALSEPFSLSVGRGEAVALLGPGGRDVLAMVGGALRPGTGRIVLGGEEVTREPTHRRRTATVLPPSTLFGRMTVAENIAYGLRRQGAGAAEVERRVAELLALADLRRFAALLPDRLDAAQGWRAALARAAAPRPLVLLLPEPVPAMDALLTELRRREAPTVLFATEDPERAIALADRIAVFEGPALLQCGTPRELWDRPANRAVARALGPVNLLAPGDAPLSAEAPAPLYALRPERIRLVAEAPPVNGGVGVVEAGLFQGDSVLLTVRGAAGVALSVRAPSDAAPRLGATVALAWEAAALAPLAA